MPRIPNVAPNKNAAHPFDLKYGTDTAGYLRPDELRGGQPNDEMNNGYSAVAPSVFREACRRWRETFTSTSTRVDAYTFVDVGAGKGRALLLASELPFRKVIGIELNGYLASVAQQNVDRWNRVARPRTKIRVLQQDAIEFKWPRTPLLVFLNNPFDCALVLQLAGKLSSVASSGPGLVDLLYVNPGCADELGRRGLFKLAWNAVIEMDEADKRSDPYGADADRVANFKYSVT